jgi:hypothetical protein
MTPSPIDLLRETGESDALDNGPTSEQLEAEANNPASEAFVKRKVRAHADTCWVKKLRLWLAFGMGAVFAAQVGGYFMIRASLREAVRGAVLEVLREHKVIATAPVNPDAVAVGEAIAVEVIRGGNRP